MAGVPFRWVSARRVAVRYVSSRAPLSPVRATCTAPGAAPLVGLHGPPGSVCAHGSSSTGPSPLPAGACACDLCSRLSPGEGPSPSVLVLVSVAVPRADSSAPSDSSSGPWRFGGGSLPSCPLACTSRRKAPVFPREDANKTREVAHWQRSHPLSAAPQTEPGGEAGCPRHSATGPTGAPRVAPPAVVLTGAVGLAGI